MEDIMDFFSPLTIIIVVVLVIAFFVIRGFGRKWWK